MMTVIITIITTIAVLTILRNTTTEIDNYYESLRRAQESDESGRIEKLGNAENGTDN